jgi:hypothetical protein
MKTLLQLFAGCRHRRRSFPQRDSKTGRDLERCLDCGRLFDSKVKFGSWMPEKERNA